MRRGLDHVDTRKITRCARSRIAPVLHRVFGHVPQTIIRTGPDHSFRARRLRDRENRSVKIGAAVVTGQRTSGWAECRFVFASEIAANGRPASSFVSRLE